MTRHCWYRNSDWVAAIETAFSAKLGRAKDTGQYLRVQAGILANEHPLVALRLLDQYFTLGDRFDLAQAHVDRAAALLALDDAEGGIDAYEAALSAEERRPNVLTSACLDLPLLIALRKDEMRYGRALELLEKGASRLTFPVEHFRWNAAMALIASALGKTVEASEHARMALTAAAKEDSGFRRHPRFGLVGGDHDEIRRELARVVSA